MQHEPHRETATTTPRWRASAGTLKRELVHLNNYATREQAKAFFLIFEYIEVFSNRRRHHSAIGYASPESFEASLNGRD